ncbi:MAG: hydantoinase B/oxoprolinase family protein [Alphaproteobacteria bacterium]
MSTTDQHRDELDPITLEVVRHKLTSIADEMQMTLLRSSFSPIVKEGLDASASLFSLDGETISQSCSIPIHLATLIPAVDAMLEAYPLAEMRQGDAFVLNDPYCGGTHLPDLAVMMPVFHDGKPVALSAAMTHHGDVGGMSPGSVPTNATEIYQEGLRIPPLKLMDAGTYNDTFVRLARQNVRLPDEFMGDLNAQIAACTVGARRLAELAGQHGNNALQAMFAALIDRSERMTRAALREMPAGTYRFVDYLDNDGIDLDKPVRIEVAVNVADGWFDVDFTGTSEQVRGPFNCVRSGVQAAAYYAVHALTDPTIPTNAGCFRPVRFTLPEGSVVNPSEPAPVNSRTSTIKRITSTIIGALAEALPERVPAASAGELLVLAFGGVNQHGRRFVSGELIAGGSGASSAGDGVDVIETDATNCMNLPVEALEMDAPIRVLRSHLAAGSGGAGKHRGGLGLEREYEVLAGDLSLTYRGERHFSAAHGLAGGGDGGRAMAAIERVGGAREEIPSKIVTRLGKGDRLLIRTAGGAGWGDPADRDPAAAREDADGGKV